jgi:hypothetical protein
MDRCARRKRPHYLIASIWRRLYSMRSVPPFAAKVKYGLFDWLIFYPENCSDLPWAGSHGRASLCGRRPRFSVIKLWLKRDFHLRCTP